MEARVITSENFLFPRRSQRLWGKAPKRAQFTSQYPKRGKSKMTKNAPERRTRQATKFQEKNEAKAQVPKPPKAKAKHPGTKYVKKVRTVTKAKVTKKKATKQ